MAAILHDVGKVTVPDHVLRKREPLTEREWEAIKRSPVRGAEMVARIQGLEEIVPWIRHSHEHLDGSGYPDGLSGDAIPLSARILRIADVFDALTTARSYRRRLTPREALELMEDDVGSFDPDVFALFKEIFPEIVGTAEAAVVQMR